MLAAVLKLIREDHCQEKNPYDKEETTPLCLGTQVI